MKPPWVWNARMPALAARSTPFHGIHATLARGPRNQPQCGGTLQKIPDHVARPEGYDRLGRRVNASFKSTARRSSNRLV